MGQVRRQCNDKQRNCSLRDKTITKNRKKQITIIARRNKCKQAGRKMTSYIATRDTEVPNTLLPLWPHCQTTAHGDSGVVFTAAPGEQHEVPASQFQW